jgi:hypothetical protein
MGISSAIFLKKEVLECIQWPKIWSQKGGVSFSFRNCTKYVSLFERKAVGQQDMPNLVKLEKKVSEHCSGLHPFEKELPERPPSAFYHKNIPGCRHHFHNLFWYSWSLHFILEVQYTVRKVRTPCSGLKYAYTLAHVWNIGWMMMTDKGQEKTYCLVGTFFTMKPTWTAMGLKESLCGRSMARGKRLCLKSTQINGC